MFGFGKKWIKSIGSGKISNISNCSDEVFSQKMLGDGYVFYPEDSAIFSPISGIIQTIFETKHAIVIRGDDGIEILIHVGLDTVKMPDGWIELMVAVGEKVKEGDLLAKADYQKVLDAGFKTETPVLISNHDQFKIKEIVEGPADKDFKAIQYS